eukprot:gene9405-12666_t
MFHSALAMLRHMSIISLLFFMIYQYYSATGYKFIIKQYVITSDTAYNKLIPHYHIRNNKIYFISPSSSSPSSSVDDIIDGDVDEISDQTSWKSVSKIFFQQKQLQLDFECKTNLDIRNAKFSDLGSVINLRTAVFYSAYKHDLAFQKTLLDKLRRRFDRGTICLLAFRNCNEIINSNKNSNGNNNGNRDYLEMVGSIEINSFDFIATPMEAIGSTRKLYAADLAIREDSRRLGIATALLKSVEFYAVKNGYEEIYLHVETENPVAQKMYLKNGYIIYPSSEPSNRFTESHLQRPAGAYVFMYKRLIIN